MARLIQRPWLFGLVIGALIAILWGGFILRGSATVRIGGGAVIGGLWGVLQAEVASFHNRNRRSR